MSDGRRVLPAADDGSVGCYRPLFPGLIAAGLVARVVLSLNIAARMAAASPFTAS